LNTIEEENLLENIRDRGVQLLAGLEHIAARFDYVNEIRSEGLMIGIDLAVEGREYVAAALRRGLIINCTNDHVIRLLPPFIVTERQVQDFLKIFGAVLQETKRPAAIAPQAAEPTVPRLRVAAR
jgi:acetylornithine/succinyldiaminopimelate/putrescine aminotransferase